MTSITSGPIFQIDIGRQIKTASERGIRIIAASVPHRSDDVVRSNSELRGRTLNIDTEFWTEQRAGSITSMGFKSLNMQIQERMITRLAQNTPVARPNSCNAFASTFVIVCR